MYATLTEPDMGLLQIQWARLTLAHGAIRGEPETAGAPNRLPQPQGETTAHHGRAAARHSADPSVEARL
jgi:hypothetical protein